MYSHLLGFMVWKLNNIRDLKKFMENAHMENYLSMSKNFASKWTSFNSIFHGLSDVPSLNEVMAGKWAPTSLYSLDSF